MEADLTYAKDIRPLFRDRDVQSMLFAFDLSSYDDVRENAEAIYGKLADGTMPCDGAWAPEEVARFRAWIDAGDVREEGGAAAVGGRGDDAEASLEQLVEEPEAQEHPGREPGRPDHDQPEHRALRVEDEEGAEHGR